MESSEICDVLRVGTVAVRGMLGSSGRLGTLEMTEQPLIKCCSHCEQDPGAYSCGKCVRRLLCSNCNYVVSVVESKLDVSELLEYIGWSHVQ